jgi:hypothetical protein
MEIVYVLWFNNFNSDDELVGIYSSEEQAELRLSNYDQRDQRSMRIEPYELNS